MRIKSGFSEEEIAFDRKNVWHPYTSVLDPLPTYPVVSAKGVRLKLANGNELIDGMSSWWTAIHGYNVPELNAAAEDQLNKMAHVMFGGITHRPAIELCQKLVGLSPEGLDHVFLCDSGSVSVEVAMKMAVQFQNAKKQTERTRFMTFKRGYHGDTSGAMAVCDPDTGMHHLFSDFLPKHHFADPPELGFDKELSPEEEVRLRQFFSNHAHESAAFILEPIVQGAGGMRVYAPDYLKVVKRLCEEHGILLIADEIATGFGRTGKLFACEHAAITPDIMCVGKALTGGYVSLAATLCTTTVAETICSGDAGVFMHGPTFMGNPLSCAIAVESLNLLMSSGWMNKVEAIEQQLNSGLEQAKSYNSVEDVRIIGAIGVVQMKKDIPVKEAQEFFVEQGVWIRPFKDLLYIMPPYVINSDDLSQIIHAMLQYCKLN